MTSTKKGQEQPTSSPKKPGIKAEIDKGKAELSDDELKKVTGGAPPGKTRENPT